jgi:hypothetical protein
MSPEELANGLAGNWLRFESFSWHDRPDDAEAWCIVYTHHRDSDALARSNARVMRRELAPYLDGEDCRSESHGHWAYGWIDGFAIRVRREGKLTDAFRVYAANALAMQDYPILDEADFSAEEREEAHTTWGQCYSDRERLDYIREHAHYFDACFARWERPLYAWRTLLANVRGKQFNGYASEMCR